MITLNTTNVSKNEIVIEVTDLVTGEVTEVSIDVTFTVNAQNANDIDMVVAGGIFTDTLEETDMSEIEGIDTYQMEHDAAFITYVESII